MTAAIGAITSNLATPIQNVTRKPQTGAAEEAAESKSEQVREKYAANSNDQVQLSQAATTLAANSQVANIVGSSTAPQPLADKSQPGSIINILK